MITHLTAAVLLFFFVVIVRKYARSLGSYFLELGVSIITGGLLLTEINGTFGYNIILVGIVVTFFGVTKIFKRLKEIAIKDYLTGLYTRYYFFEEWLPREMERQKRKSG
ncbi:MAG: Diguanylate cyclase, partial [Thermotoga petrophila]